MTDVDTIEERVRRALKAVADQPIDPPGSDLPFPVGGPRSRPHRRGMLVGVAATVVVLAGLGLALALGPRSSTTGGSPASSLNSQTVQATFVPTAPTTAMELSHAAATVRARLRALGDGRETVTVSGGHLQVRGPAIPRSDLQVAVTRGTLLFRPAECAATSYSPPPAGSSSSSTGTTLPPCGAQYQLTPINLGQTVAGGTVKPVVPDPAFTSIASTPPSHDDPVRTVLLPAQSVSGSSGTEAARYVLGPAQLDGSSIAGVEARHEASQWIIDITLTPAGSVRWDAVAEQNFHMIVGIDVDGQVISAPMIEPSNTAFVSFGGRFQISGNFTAAQAKDLAVILGHGPLAPAFELQSLQRT